MNNLKLLMKISLFSLLAMTLLNSCSSDIDELNDTLNSDGIDKDSRVILKINESNYQEHFESNQSNQKIHSFTWRKTQNNDGTNGFSISGEIEYIPSPTEISLQGPGNFNLDINKNIQQGQVYDVKYSNFQFGINFLSGLSSSSVYYDLQKNTIGQLKITFFDGVTMSGEFSFDKIRFSRGDTWKNDDTKITGAFTKIEELKN